MTLTTFIFYESRFQRKSAFEHAQNSQLQIILRIRKETKGTFSIPTFCTCSVQWFCQQTVNALIRLCDCAGWSGPSLSANARKNVFAWRGPFYVGLIILAFNPVLGKKNIFAQAYPADTWRLYNVGLTSMQRHDVASTLRRRCINVMCLLG